MDYYAEPQRLLLAVLGSSHVLEVHRSLACLSTRFALEFNIDETAHDVALAHQHAQVEQNMQLCGSNSANQRRPILSSPAVPVTAGLDSEKMVTILGFRTASGRGGVSAHDHAWKAQGRMRCAIRQHILA
jgi:hypothetical protein